MTASTRPPAGMPPHLWELAKSDSRGAVPERIRRAGDTGANAPTAVRAVARRAATASATLGVAAAAIALGASSATAGPVVDPAALELHLAPSGLDDPGPGGHLGGEVGATAHADAQSHGFAGEGPVSSGLGSTFRVEHPDAPGPQHTLSVSIFQDVSVVETADGNFQVDAYQFIVIRDSQGHEYVFTEHYQVTVPDPPGQETDLAVHETGRAHVVENADGSFTPVGVDHGIVVTVGSDGNGRDDVHIRQDESVRVDEHGRPDPHDTTVVLGERATSTTHDPGDPAYTSIDQSTSTGLARSHPAPVTGAGAAIPVVFAGPTTGGSEAPPRDPLFERTAPVDHGPFHGPDPHPTPSSTTSSGGGAVPDDVQRHDGGSPGTEPAASDTGTHGTGTHDTGHENTAPETTGHESTSHESTSHETTGHETAGHESAPTHGSDGGEHLVPTAQLH